jgi:hypothetical protein
MTETRRVVGNQPGCKRSAAPGKQSIVFAPQMGRWKYCHIIDPSPRPGPDTNSMRIRLARQTEGVWPRFIALVGTTVPPCPLSSGRGRNAPSVGRDPRDAIVYAPKETTHGWTKSVVVERPETVPNKNPLSRHMHRAPHTSVRSTFNGD